MEWLVYWFNRIPKLLLFGIHALLAALMVAFCKEYAPTSFFIASCIVAGAWGFGWMIYALMEC